MAIKGKHLGFAKRLREMCEATGVPWTQKAVAKVFKVSGPQASYYMNGRKLLVLERAIMASERLGCCVEYLLTGRGPKRPKAIKEESERVTLDITHLSDEKRQAVRGVVRALDGETDGSAA